MKRKRERLVQRRKMAGYSQERLAEVLRIERFRIGSDDSDAEFFSPTQLGRLAGSCYLFLGHPERAEPILKPTAEALHARPKTRLLVLGNLALA